MLPAEGGRGADAEDRWEMEGVGLVARRRAHAVRLPAGSQGLYGRLDEDGVEDQDLLCCRGPDTIWQPRLRRPLQTAGGGWPGGVFHKLHLPPSAEGVSRSFRPCRLPGLPEIRRRASLRPAVQGREVRHAGYESWVEHAFIGGAAVGVLECRLQDRLLLPTAAVPFWPDVRPRRLRRRQGAELRAPHHLRANVTELQDGLRRRTMRRRQRLHRRATVLGGHPQRCGAGLGARRRRGHDGRLHRLRHGQGHRHFETALPGFGKPEIRCEREAGVLCSVRRERGELAANRHPGLTPMLRDFSGAFSVQF
mmetsp:Transcript_32155/g.93951  ORF Transcript_32155/g.93951 Transcript_32155/m.93951 type:complete len:308 (+) Transcript_32155:210-1133(+)